ncbi:MAG: hypothetical protein LBG97_04115 [Coriobacteriales bacterium]|jgi:hypothetical protein|nr:hypothetical protein [Coriobacteriales bacterium]
MDTIDIVRIAFRKLKAHVYFDKTTLPLRDKVVGFEVAHDFKKKMAAIATAYESKGLPDDDPLIKEILNSITVLPFPKRMCTSKHDEDSVISVGNPKELAIVEDLQYFIDMDVAGHILGIMWILAFGKRLDEMCFDKARGNRLRSSLIWNDDGEPISNPALFEPYFAQYSLWRDAGLTCAEDLLSKGHDALILTLDLKKFYYQVGLTEEVFSKLIEKEDSISNRFLHSVVFSIMQRYTEVLTEKGIEHNGVVLPIGFLPSAVLSNWCLHNFDQGILDFWNPSYYGRYVDDIIIVEKIEKGSLIYKKARENTPTKESVIEYYLGKERRKKSASFVERSTDAEPACSADETCDPSDNVSYRVCKPFCLSEESKLEFQAEKTRIIALFADNNSRALLNRFKKEIHENVSEFRLMPEVGEAFSQDDFSEFYRIDNDATVNKLRGIKEISMDKFELSKFLGKYRVASSLVDDGSTKRFTKIIGKMFNDRELIDNYILWERVFEIFITDKDYAGFDRFSKKVHAAIDAVTIRFENSDKNEPPDALRESLHRHFDATLNRVLSLLWGEEVKKVIPATKKVSRRQAYLETRMSNKYVMAIPNEIVSCPSDESVDTTINFTNFTDSFNYICAGNTCPTEQYDYLPYFRQAHDISFEMLLSTICPNSDTKKKFAVSEYIQEIQKQDKEAPLFKGTNNEHLIVIGDAVSNKLRIAIANVNVGDVSNLDDVLKGRKPNRHYKRYRALANLVNDAIKEKAEMLVFPENYVPLEWLPFLASKAAREGLAIVTGVEHVIAGDAAHNLTAVILPFKYFKTIPTSAMFFQLKKHYSPEEKRIIEGYGYRIPREDDKEISSEDNKRPLYRWHDCYFPVYCCYELASINDRAEFMSWADMVVAVECNRDVNYFGNIVESLARDLHCYFVQVNTSEFGDSRITQPRKSEERNLIVVKGGMNHSLLIGEIAIQELREFQIKNYTLQKSGAFKPTPPGFNTEIVRKKIERNI